MSPAAPEDLEAATKAVIHPCFHRPALLWGAERIFTLMNLGASFELAVLADGKLAALMAIGIFAAGLQGLAARAAKKDPHAFAVYLRCLRQQPFYPAKSPHDGPIPTYP